MFVIDAEVSVHSIIIVFTLHTHEVVIADHRRYGHGFCSAVPINIRTSQHCSATCSKYMEYTIPIPYWGKSHGGQRARGCEPTIPIKICSGVTTSRIICGSVTCWYVEAPVDARVVHRVFIRGIGATGVTGDLCEHIRQGQAYYKRDNYIAP